MTKEYEFTLSQSERTSHVWKKIMAHIDHLIEKERVRNDKITDIIKTSHTRGKIAALLELKKLNDASYVNPDEDE